MVMLEEAEYDRLKQKADEWEPLLPEPNADGNYPAREYMLASIARDIIRHRRCLGLIQVELARKAGIRPETLNGIEHTSLRGLRGEDRPGLEGSRGANGEVG